MIQDSLLDLFLLKEIKRNGKVEAPIPLSPLLVEHTSEHKLRKSYFHQVQNI